MSSPLPVLFLTEAILKVIGGATFYLSPGSILKHITSAPYSPTALSLVRSLGTQTIAFSIPLFLAARSDPVSVSSRRIVYWALLGREGCLGLGLLGQIAWSHYRECKGSINQGDERERLLEEGVARDFEGEEEDNKIERRKFRHGLWLWFAEVVPFIAARVWVLQAKLEWFD